MKSGKTYTFAFTFVDRGELADLVQKEGTKKLDLGMVLENFGKSLDAPTFWYRASREKGSPITYDEGSDGWLAVFPDGSVIDDDGHVSVVVGQISVDPLGLSGDVYSYKLTLAVPPKARYLAKD
jgi:hypothetical protein